MTEWNRAKVLKNQHVHTFHSFHVFSSYKLCSCYVVVCCHTYISQVLLIFDWECIYPWNMGWPGGKNELCLLSRLRITGLPISLPPLPSPRSWICASLFASSACQSSELHGTFWPNGFSGHISTRDGGKEIVTIIDIQRSKCIEYQSLMVAKKILCNLITHLIRLQLAIHMHVAPVCLCLWLNLSSASIQARKYVRSLSLSLSILSFSPFLLFHLLLCVCVRLYCYRPTRQNAPVHAVSSMI